MTDSPGLRAFLLGEGLQNGCWIKHIAINYRGEDAPYDGKGRGARMRQWLAGLSFIEYFDDEKGEPSVRIKEVQASPTTDCSGNPTPAASELDEPTGDSPSQSEQSNPRQVEIATRLCDLEQSTGSLFEEMNDDAGRPLTRRGLCDRLYELRTMYQEFRAHFPDLFEPSEPIIAMEAPAGPVARTASSVAVASNSRSAQTVQHGGG